MLLTDENYYSDEANKYYMSVSQYKDFMACEAAAMAKLSGWKQPTSDSCLVGSYIHAWNEGTQEKFKQQHPEIFSKKGELLAKYQQADEMIKALESDPFVTFALQGKKEVIFTAEFAGTLWKIKIDVHNKERERLADLKTTRSITEKNWSAKDGCRVSFLEEYGHIMQVAVYTEIERLANNRENSFDPFIVAVSKENPPDKAIISFDRDRLDYELAVVSGNMPHILAVKRGEAKPTSCGKCYYCRSVKKVTKVLHYSEI